MPLLRSIAILAAAFFLVILAQWLGDLWDLHLPWYLLHECLLIGVPMAWLLWRVFPHLSQGDRLAFVTVSVMFTTLGAIFELVALAERYWWFYQQDDILSGLRIGAAPVEEFIYYPFILNIPVLAYVYIQRFVPAQERPLVLTLGIRRSLDAAAAVIAVTAIALFIYGQSQRTPILDPSILPSPDASGALRYSAGPREFGWSVVQMLATATTAFMLARATAWVHARALLFLVAFFACYAFFLELMACGRGWWVWNHQQVLGVFVWVIPIDSFMMYLTGSLLPPMVFERLRRFYGSRPA